MNARVTTPPKMIRSAPSATAKWLLILLLPFLLCACVDSPTPRPNILLIAIDTLRASDLSHAGYNRETSPHLDSLANKSVEFRNTASAGANTTVEMSSLMTGKFPYFEFGEPWSDEYSFGMNRFYTKRGEIGLPDSLESLAERLLKAGYYTAGIVTNPYLKRVYPFDQGFPVYEELMVENSYATGDKVTPSALSLLDSIKLASLIPSLSNAEPDASPTLLGNKTLSPLPGQTGGSGKKRKRRHPESVACPQLPRLSTCLPGYV